MTGMTPAESFSPTEEMTTRCKLPEQLYIIVDSVAFPTINHDDGSVVTPHTGDFHAKLDFVCEKLTRDHLSTHLRHSNCSAMESYFISAFEDEETALRAPPLRASDMIEKELIIPHATKLIIDTSKLHAGWIDTPLGRIPVWFEHGELPKVPRGVLYMTREGVEAFDASIWICVAEVREFFGLKPYHGQKGEWLACGFIPRSMVAAQVVLHDYQRKPEVAHHVPKRKGSIRSIRSISSKEQEEHVKEQIARNKASKEDLRSKPVLKKLQHDSASSLLRQAMENNKAKKQAESNETTATVPRAPKNQTKLRQRATFPLRSVAIEESIEISEDPSRYASVRSSKLREALERNQVSRSREALDETRRLPISQGRTDEQLPRHSSNEPGPSSSFNDRDSRYVGESPSNQRQERRKVAVMEEPYEQGSEAAPYKGSIARSCRKDLSNRVTLEEEWETLPPSERLRRARARKMKVVFVKLEPMPKPESGHDDEVENILSSVADVSDAASVLDELANTKVKFTLPEPPLSSEDESFSSYGAPSITDEDPPLVEQDDDDLVESQTSASGRAFGSRRSKKLPQTTHMGFEELVSSSKPEKRQPARHGRPELKLSGDLGDQPYNATSHDAKIGLREVYGIGSSR